MATVWRVSLEGCPAAAGRRGWRGAMAARRVAGRGPQPGRAAPAPARRPPAAKLRALRAKLRTRRAGHFALRAKRSALRARLRALRAKLRALRARFGALRVQAFLPCAQSPELCAQASELCARSVLPCAQGPELCGPGSGLCAQSVLPCARSCGPCGRWATGRGRGSAGGGRAGRARRWGPYRAPRWRCSAASVDGSGAAGRAERRGEPPAAGAAGGAWSAEARPAGRKCQAPRVGFFPGDVRDSGHRFGPIGVVGPSAPDQRRPYPAAGDFPTPIRASVPQAARAEASRAPCRRVRKFRQALGIFRHVFPQSADVAQAPAAPACARRPSGPAPSDKEADRDPEPDRL